VNTPHFSDYDLVIVGGGAAGYFGAITFAELAAPARTLIVERSGSVLGKVRISGGGRCNVTHACEAPRPLTTHYPRGERSLLGPFHHWGVAETISWFAAAGVELHTEADGRMFPITNQSETIVRCLRETAARYQVELFTKWDVAELSRDPGGWQVLSTEGAVIRARAVLLASGGIRSGGGERIAVSAGHRVVPPVPSLFTFKIEDSRLTDLAGLAVPSVTIVIPETKLSSHGPCLVTHWGLSGPAVLKLSAWGARQFASSDYRQAIRVNWTGTEGRDSIDQRLLQVREVHPKRRVVTGLADLSIPSRLWQRLCAHSGIADDLTWSQLSKELRLRLGEELVSGTYQVTGQSLNKDEFVTAGGVDLKEVNLRTMESKVAEGLYFAGEVLDIDGVTGGFNFQAAWTTARLAGEAAAARHREGR
jgi:predicted Rossmann fold flavoprotein